MVKQSVEERLRRFNQRLCPIHGTGLEPISSWFIDGYGRVFINVECPRRDCEVSGRVYRDGGYLLDSEHAHLVNQAPLDPLLLNATLQDFGPKVVLEEPTEERLWAYIRQTSREWQQVIDQAVNEYLDRSSLG